MASPPASVVVPQRRSPVGVRLKRSGCVESVHRVHAVVCDQRGRILMRAGQANYETFIRSALKPFQALPFLSSGAAAQVDCGDRGIAISCASMQAPLAMPARPSRSSGTPNWRRINCNAQYQWVPAALWSTTARENTPLSLPPAKKWPGQRTLICRGITPFSRK